MLAHAAGPFTENNDHRSHQKKGCRQQIEKKKQKEKKRESAASRKVM